MDETQFLALCRHASSALGLADIERLGTHGHLDIEGTHLVVFFDETTTPDQMRFYADLGPVSSDKDGKQLRQLLGFNLLSPGVASGVCALDPVSGHGLLVVTLWVDADTSGDQLAQALLGVATQAKALRHALAEPSVPAGVPA